MQKMWRFSVKNAKFEQFRAFLVRFYSSELMFTFLKNDVPKLCQADIFFLNFTFFKKCGQSNISQS